MSSPSAQRLLLHKRVQSLPLRSPQNLALYDARKLDYNIRQTLQKADRLSSANILKDFYMEELLFNKPKDVFAELVPKQHRRVTASAGVSPEGSVYHPSRRGSKVMEFGPEFSPGTVSKTPSGAVSPILTPTLSRTVQRATDILRLQVRCRKAKSSIRVEKKAIARTRKRAVKDFGRCTTDLKKVLKRKEETKLGDYKRTFAEKRNSLAYPYNAKRPTIFDYRKNFEELMRERGIHLTPQPILF